MRALTVVGAGQRGHERELLRVRRVGDVDGEEAAALAASLDGLRPGVEVGGVLVDREVGDLARDDPGWPGSGRRVRSNRYCGGVLSSSLREQLDVLARGRQVIRVGPCCRAKPLRARESRPLRRCRTRSSPTVGRRRLAFAATTEPRARSPSARAGRTCGRDDPGAQQAWMRTPFLQLIDPFPLAPSTDPAPEPALIAADPIAASSEVRRTRPEPSLCPNRWSCPPDRSATTPSRTRHPAPALPLAPEHAATLTQLPHGSA